MYVPLAVECYLFDHIYINKTYPIWSSPKSDEKTEFKENTLYAKYKGSFYAKTDYLCAATGRMYVPGWAERRSKEWEKHLSLGLGGHKHKLIQWKQKLMERLQLHNVSLSCLKIKHIFKCYIVSWTLEYLCQTNQSDINICFFFIRYCTSSKPVWPWSAHGDSWLRSLCTVYTLYSRRTI